MTVNTVSALSVPSQADSFAMADLLIYGVIGREFSLPLERRFQRRGCRFLARRSPAAEKTGGEHLAQDAAADPAVRESGVGPEEAVVAHGPGSGDETRGELGEVGVGVVVAEDEAAGADPAH